MGWGGVHDQRKGYRLTKNNAHVDQKVSPVRVGSMPNAKIICGQRVNAHEDPGIFDSGVGYMPNAKIIHVQRVNAHEDPDT